MQNIEQQLQLALNECKRLKEENTQLKALLKYYNINPNVTNPFPNNKTVQTTKNQKIQERLDIFKDLLKEEPMYLRCAGNLKIVSLGTLQHVLMNGTQPYVRNLQ